MRSIVGVLRRGEADLAPQRGLADLKRLADDGRSSPPVDVELTGDLADVRPSIQTAIYRIAQESITNIRRHARRATRAAVHVDGDDEQVRLTIVDDGDPSSYTADSTSGYGLVGMTERAALHGGTFEAGPNPGRGWTVRAVLPKAGSTS